MTNLCHLNLIIHHIHLLMIFSIYLYFLSKIFSYVFDFKTNTINFNLDYLEENNISENKEYVTSAVEYKKGQNGLFAFSNKRNLITNSSEYYKLSYEYIND